MAASYHKGERALRKHARQAEAAFRGTLEQRQTTRIGIILGLAAGLFYAVETSMTELKAPAVKQSSATFAQSRGNAAAANGFSNGKDEHAV